MAVTTTYSLVNTLAETIANTYTNGNQLVPDVTGLSNGGYVVAYNNDDAATGRMLLNFYDASSNVIGTYKVPAGVSNAIGQPSVTQLSNGNVLVVWDENYSSKVGISGRLFTASGTAIGSELSLSTANGIDVTPDVTALSGGGFVISYATGGDSYASIYNNAGALQTNVAIESIATGNQFDPVVTALGDGGFAITFVDDSTGNNEIYTRTYNPNGNARTLNPILVDSYGDNTEPAIAALPSGNYAMAYTDSGWASENGTTGITLIIHNASGANLSPYIHVNNPSTGAGKNESQPAITVLDNGFIVVSWTYPFSGTDGDIYGRVFDQTGNAITIGGNSGEFVLTSSNTNDIASAVSVLLGGEFVTVWQDSDTSDGSLGRITRE